MKHVDDWLDEVSMDEDECYAKFVLDNKRWPAWKVMYYDKWMEQFKLFCSYEGKRYRVTGCSRMGDVWLHSDFNHDHGYEKRVDIEKCHNWSPAP